MLKKIIKKNWLLILIILLAVFLRLYRIGDYMEFLGDQGRDVLIIRDFLKNGNLFFIGPQTSIGNMYLGPYFYYLIAPALLLSNFNPVGPAIFIALINIATVFLTYWVGTKWFNKSTGLIAAFIFAISPVAIKYSTFIWNPNIMAFFSLLFVYLFFTSFRTKKYKYFIFASLAFVMVMNSHYLGLALLPFIGLYWLFYLIKFIKTKSNQLKPFLVNTILAVFVFILSLIPQVLFDIKHNGQNFKALLTFFTQRETTVSIKPYKSIPELPNIFNQINTSLLGGKIETYGLIISIVFAFLLLLTLIKFKTQKSSFWYIFLWFLSGIISLALYKQHVYDHYFTFLFPVVFLFIAFLISKYKLLGIPLLIAISVFSITQNPFKQSPNYQLVHSKNNAAAITQHSQESDGNYNITMLAAYNDFRALAPRYFLTNMEQSGRLLDQEKYQEANTLFVIIDDPTKWPEGINSDIWEINIFDSREIADEFFSSDGVKIFKLTHNQND